MSSNAVRRRAAPQMGTLVYPEAGAADDSAEVTASNLQRDLAGREESARQAGFRAGEAAARERFEVQIEKYRQNLAAELENFGRQRREYFLTVEKEVVQLALAIARKIIHRESQLDPLLLAGMIRVMLERMANSSKVRVRAHPQQVSEFRMFFARQLPDSAPEVVEDANLSPETCVLETDFGTTEIGPEIQLKEIEQGLLDLQTARPH